MATDRQQGHALISHFLKRYKKMYGTNPPGLNRHALVHGFEALHKDYPGMGQDIIDYYFDNYEEHSPIRFTYEYGRVVETIEEAETDRLERLEIRRATKERMRSVTNRSEGDQGSPKE